MAYSLLRTPYSALALLPARPRRCRASTGPLLTVCALLSLAIYCPRSFAQEAPAPAGRPAPLTPEQEWQLERARDLNGKVLELRDAGKAREALPLAREALRIQQKILGEQRPDYAASLISLALLYRAMGEYAKAEPLVREAMASQTNFANGILPFLPEARAMAMQSGSLGCHLLLSILRNLPATRGADAYAAVWQTRGLVSRAMIQRRGAVAESPQAQEVFLRLRATAQQLAQLTLAVPKPDQQEARQKRLGELNDEKEGLEAELARASDQFRRSQQIAEATPEDLVRLLPKNTAVVEFLSTAVWRRPPSGRGALVAQQHYDAFVLRNGPGGPAITWVQLGPAQPIDDALAQWRREITRLPPLPPGEGRGEGSAASSPAQLLRENLWAKIEPHLGGCKTLLIIPDDQLCFLPWAALPGRSPGTCLLEDYAIVTPPSARHLFAMLTEAESPGSGLLLVGGVDFDAPPSALAEPGATLAARDKGTVPFSSDENRDSPPLGRTRGSAMKTRPTWRALPGAAREIEDVEKLWPGRPAATVLRGAAASEAALRRGLSGSRYVHLATHGFFADPAFRSMFGHDVQGEQLFGGSELLTARRAQVTVRNPLILSGVVLAGANLAPKTDALDLPTGEDGILTAEEIVNLDLRRTELVVLSACDTGLGSVAGGEGVMGLARAFHVAGARNVIASLWKVDDDATAALMKLFYHKLWHENKPPIAALREAQLFIYRHPDEIKTLSTARGPDLAKTVPLVDGGRRSPQSPTAPAKLWAAFLLSGSGQ